MSTPKDRREAKIFVNNMMSYINEHEFDSTLLVLKIKIQTRYNDYKNKALNFEYFKDNLVKMQRELVSRICMFSDWDKKIDEVSYEMMGRKRIRTDYKSNEKKISNDISNNTSEIKSDTSESNSFDSCCSDKTPTSSKLNKKTKGKDNQFKTPNIKN